jgi:hypothetical protein
MAGSSGGNWIVGAIVAKLVLDKSGWTTSVNKVLDDGRRMSGMSDKTAKAFTTMGTTMTMMGAAIVGSLGLCVKEASEFGTVSRQLDAVLKSTGGAAGVTRDAALGLSEALQQETTYSDEAVLSAENLLLTFTSIGKDIFPDATRAVLDISTALGQDLKSSAIQVGKALQDPALGVTALRRVGVNFTKDQQEMIKTLVETGHKLAAQKIILSELATEFGGSASAAAQGFSGQMKQLKNDINDVQKDIGMALMPVLKNMVMSLKPIVESIGNWVKANPQLVSTLAGIGLKAGILLSVLGAMMGIIPKIVGLFTSIISLGPQAVAWISKLTLATAAGTLAWTAAIAAIGFYIIKLQEKAQAEGYAIDATNKAKEAQDKLAKKLEAAMIQAGMSKEEITKLEQKYKDLAGSEETWAAQMGMAIKKGEEGVKVQQALVEVGKEHAEQVQKGAIGIQGLTDDIYEMAGELKGAAKAQKEFSDWLKGLAPDAEELGFKLKTIEDLYSAGKISTPVYIKAIKEISDGYGELGININKVLPPARDMSAVMGDLKPKIGELPRILEDTAYGFADIEDAIKDYGDSLGFSANTVKAFIYEIERMQLALLGIHLPALSFEPMTKEAKITSKSMTDIFAGGFNDIAQKFGDTLSQFVEEGFNFKTLWEGLWGSIKDTFFRILGEMATKFVTDFLGGLVTNSAKAAGEAASNVLGSATSAVSGITNILSGGLATAIGSFAGTFLAGVLGGGPSGHQQQQQINDSKDSRNYLAEIRNWLYSAGTGFGGAIWDFSQKFTNEKIDEAKGFIADVKDTLAPKLDHIGNLIGESIGWLASIDKRLANVKSAQSGAYIKEPALLQVHANEAVVPLDRLPMFSTSSGKGTGKSMAVTNEIHLNGNMITDREYVRGRLMPEIIGAIESNIWKSRMQSALGLTQ